MDAVVKEEEYSVNDGRNMIEPKEEVIDESYGLIEPKVELVDEMEVKKEEINEDEYKHMIPYEYRDYVEQPAEKKEPEKSRKRQAEQESPLRKKTVECQVCQKTMVRGYLTQHVATHSTIKRFSCHIEGCDYKSYLHHNVIVHMKHKHKMVQPNAKDVVQRELSDKEKEQLRRLKEDCFPKMIRQKPKLNREFNCRICNTSIVESSKWAQYKRRNHAFTHTDIMLYECIEPACDFKTNYIVSFEAHHSKHGINSGMILKKGYNVCPEKMLELEKMIFQCFPELKKKQGSSGQQCCNVCHRVMHIRDLTSKDFRRNHALTHTDIMLYKCCKEYCDYKAPNRYSIIDHQKSVHNTFMYYMNATQIELTNEQELEIQRMMDQCFAEWKDD